jgi:large subunit ribosomal protein L35
MPSRQQPKQSERYEVPKMKSHRGAAKRFKKTGSGKISRQKANKQHILTKKTTKRKRSLRQDTLVSKADVSRVRKMLPYL